MNKEELEIKVFDCLESKHFDDLSTEEEVLVLSIMTKDEYQLQRRIMTEAKTTNAPLPGPLVLPAKRNVVPIWVASLGSAAAAAILVFLLMQPSQVDEGRSQAESTKIIRDTLIVENTITDTIIDYRIVEVNATKSSSREEVAVQIPETVSSGPNVPPIRENDMVNRGVSAANDREIKTFQTRPFIGM
ncbi:MAG: hypothetical protein NXI10_13935 [bacterium]|nr:hypothetical protein [bacterium]